MTDWPATLPQAFLINSYRSSRPQTAIRSQPEKGPAIMRRRFSAGVAPFAGDMVMTRAQRNDLVEFFDDTLAGGTAPFWLPAQDGSDNLWLCRFTSEPEERWLSAALWQVTLQMELLPGGVQFSTAAGIGAMAIGSTFMVA